MVGQIGSVWGKRFTIGSLLASLFSLLGVNLAVASIYDAIQSQLLVSRSGTASSWLTISNSGTSNSYFTIGTSSGAATPTQTASLAIVISFGVASMIFILYVLKDELSIGTFFLVAVAGIVAMIGMLFLANLLGGI